MKRLRTLLVVPGILVALLLALAGRAAAQAPTVSLREYEALLRECHAAAQRHDIAGLRSAAERLQAVSEVELVSGEQVSVDNTWLREALNVPRPAMDQIAARLGAQLEVLVAAHEDDPQALQKLRDILSRPPFAPREKTWIERAIDSFLRFLGRLLKPIGRAIGFSGIGEALVTLLAVAALVAGLIYIIRLISGALVREARADRTKSGASDAEEEPATSSEAVSKAEELASGGDYRSAVRYLYLSTILWLHERGMLHYDRALTNYEVLRTIPPETQLHERLKPVVQTFDKVWYGHYPLDEPSFEHFRRQVAGLREGRL